MMRITGAVSWTRKSSLQNWKKTRPGKPEDRRMHRRKRSLRNRLVQKPSLEDFFGLAEGVTLTYRDYQIADSYPEDGSTEDYFALDASTGKKLLILNFELTNGTDQEENVDFLSTASRYIITVNDGTRGNALTTMLPNDMSTYVETMAPGVTQGLVLLLEVNEDMANGIQNISLRLKNTSNEYTIQLL